MLPIFVNPSPADALGLRYSRVSLPLAKGAFNVVPDVTITTAKGKAVPVQSELLASWPDKSPRVLHLTFPSSAGAYGATVGSVKSTPSPKNQITIERQDNQQVTIATGRLTAVLGGAGMVDSIRLGSQEMIGVRGIEVRVTDKHKRAFTATTANHVETIIEVEGPLWAVIALKGKCTLGAETFLDFRLRFEFLAGVEGFSLAYTFFNFERGQDFFEVGSIELELDLSAVKNPQHTVYQQSHGLFSTLGRIVMTPEPFHIAVDDTKTMAYVTNYEALGDEIEYPFYLNPPCDKVDNWVAVSDGRRGMIVEMDDFHLLRPKSLEL
ncbi:MAG TPA: hypothetical protein VNA16_02010, partial [Abditibacteriaceae bacterium]|nr:hypothetical protein [Abditibacteriaceae bacterium]